MNQQIVQRTRYLLQTRVKRVKKAGLHQYQEQLKFLLQFLESNTLFRSILDDLIAKSTLDIEEFKKALEVGNGLDFTDERQYIHAGYIALSEIVDQKHSRELIRRVAGSAGVVGDLDELIDGINTHWLSFLYDYIDESIDSRNVLLAVLLKYKQSVEWFSKKRLSSIAEGKYEGLKSGEKGLAFHLYEAVHSAGVDFSIEPSSVSGEVDLIMHQSDEDKIILDAKYFPLSESVSAKKTKIIKGFRQVYDYCCDYNQPSGYLALYNNSEHKIDIESLDIDGFQSVEISGKTIFYLVIDIFENPKSASQRGILERVHVPLKELSIDV